MIHWKTNDKILSKCFFKVSECSVNSPMENWPKKDSPTAPSSLTMKEYFVTQKEDIVKKDHSCIESFVSSFSKSLDGLTCSLYPESLKVYAELTETYIMMARRKLKES